jgi:hypothetical protein
LLYEHDAGLAVVGSVPDEWTEERRARSRLAAGTGGTWFVERVLACYSRLMDVLASKAVQIGQSLEEGLIIGDNPATTYDPARGLVGLLGGANVLDGIIVMPLTPKFVISFGTTQGYIDLDGPTRQVLNNVQYASSVDWVYAKPGSPDIPQIAAAAAADPNQVAMARRSYGRRTQPR